MRYVLKIAYDGTEYAGWQRQKNAISVQEVLEKYLTQFKGMTASDLLHHRSEKFMKMTRLDG